MQFNLGKDEKVIKSWVYASETNGKQTSQANLTVTNRRLISVVSSASEMEYSEVPIRAISRIDAGRVSVGGNFLLLVLGILIMIGGIIGAIFAGNMRYIGIVAIAVGFVLFILGLAALKNSNSGSFYLTISVEGNISGKLEIGANNIVRKGNNRSQTIRIKIDFAKVDDMLASLGAIISDCRDGKVDVKDEIAM